METLYASVVTAVITLVARELLPAARDFVSSFRADNRKSSADERKARREEAELEAEREATTVDGWKEVAEHWKRQCEILVEEGKRERHDCRDEISSLTNRVALAEAKLARAEATIEFLRERYNIPLPVSGGSDLHRISPEVGDKK